MSEIKIPIYKPYLNGNEKKYVDDAISSTWISSKGKYLKEFETRFSKYIGVNYATGVCNGTTALHLALLALGIKPGDEVMVPSFTYIASVNCIKYVGAKPVFIDCLPDSWQINPDKINTKVTKKTKAIIVVHLYGHPCDMEKISRICKKNKIYIVEDCAEAIGSEINGNKVGTFGDISAFSFFGNKTITTGEGGMVTTNNKDLYEKCLRYKGQGLAKNKEYWHDLVGYNYRMTNIEAAIGLAQLEQIDEIIIKKSNIAKTYNKFLNDDIYFHKSVNKKYFHSHWMNSILTKSSIDRDKLRKKLLDSGIETRPTFYPAHMMPMYKNRKNILPVSENIGSRGVNLPSYPDLKTDEIIDICNIINKFYGYK
jgi:perosamine synthetase